MNSQDMKRKFTIGINDDVTELSLKDPENAPDTTPEGDVYKRQVLPPLLRYAVGRRTFFTGRSPGILTLFPSPAPQRTSPTAPIAALLWYRTCGDRTALSLSLIHIFYPYFVQFFYYLIYLLKAKLSIIIVQ